MSPTSTPACFLCLFGLMLTTAGCGIPANQGNDLLNGARLSGLSGLETETTLPHETSSLTGFDRSGFPRETMIIHMASVETFPTYATPAMGGRDQDASRTFPTAMTALQRSSNSTADWNAALAAPFVAAIDLVISPVRMFGTPPWTIQLEPAGDFELLPTRQVTCEATPTPEDSRNEPEPEASIDPANEQALETPDSAGSAVPNEPVPPRAETLQRNPDAASNE